MKGKKVFSIVIVFVLIFAVGYLIQSRYMSQLASSNNTKESSKTKIIHASWVRAYDNIEELAVNSDLIGLVEITGISRVETKKTGLEGDDSKLYFTTYSAKVINGINTDKKTIEIVMTGKKDTFEIEDDPLMGIGEKWFIYARLNDSGKYTVLSGPFGRFSYNEDNNTVTSLNNVNEAVAKANPNMKINIKNMNFNEMKMQIKNYLGKN